MKRPSFGRYGLPVLAVLGILFAGFVILTGRPDRSLDPPAIQPPSPAPSQAGAVVAGAGLVEPSSELIKLSPLVPGVVRSVSVVAGQRVAAGDRLFALDDRDVRADLAEAEAALRQAVRAEEAARLAVDNARRQLELLLGVRDAAAVAEQQRLDRRQALATAEAALAVSAADRARAQARVAAARTELSRREVRAPRDGEILQVKTRPGEYVTAGPGPAATEPPITMGETRPLHVRVDIDETEITRVKLGAPASVLPRGRADLRVEAAFVRVEPLVIPKRSLTNQAAERVDVRVMQILYALPDGAQGFAIGQQVDAFLPAVAPR
jgi:multidrug resistance efflux pump